MVLIDTLRTEVAASEKFNFETIPSEIRNRRLPEWWRHRVVEPIQRKELDPLVAGNGTYRALLKIRTYADLYDWEEELMVTLLLLSICSHGAKGVNVMSTETTKEAEVVEEAAAETVKAHEQEKKIEPEVKEVKLGPAFRAVGKGVAKFAGEVAIVMCGIYLYGSLFGKK
jgi:hypothetical protein